MAHYAKVINGIVTEVIVADADFIESFDDPNFSWVQTSYNTQNGVHLTGGEPLRMNFAAVGYTYDADRDAFIPPKPYDSWVLEEETCVWAAPTPYPTDGGMYVWDEENLAWVVDPDWVG